MKVHLYRTILDDCRYPVVVKENGSYVCDGRKAFNNPDAVCGLAREIGLDRAAEEYVYCFALDTKCHIMGAFEVSHGTVNQSLISAREIFQKLLLLNAVSFIVVHNHPSGDPTPSREDDAVTKTLRNAGNLLGVSLVDHIVIGTGNYYSFNQEGR